MVAAHGRPLLNSVTGEEERLEYVLPLVKKYNVPVVAISNDDTGISEDPDVRFAVAKKIVRELSANPHATVTLAEFEELAALSASEIEMSVVRQNRNDMLGEVEGYF